MNKIVLLLFLVMVCGNVWAEQDGTVNDEWQFQLTPYLWLPTISGDLNYDPPNEGGAPIIDVGPTDWLDLLNGAFLLNAEVRKNRFLLLTDIVYLGLESDNDRIKSVSAGPGSIIPVDGSLNLETQTDIDGFTMTIAGGFNLHDDQRSSIDLFGGVRYFGLDSETSWSLSADIELPDGGTVLARQGLISNEQKSWDGIVGIKGTNQLGSSKWSINYYLDAGTGDSDLTWQAIAGVSYAFGWGDLIMSYRHFEYDGGAGELMEDFSFSGPVVGTRFSF